MIQAALTLVVSAAVGYGFYRKRIPAGMLIGAVIASAVLTAVFQVGYVPAPVKHIAQVIAGTFIGCSAKREDFRQLRSFYKPVILITLSLLAVNITIGFLLFFVGYGDLLTCLVCAIPGGISDVTLIALDFGADASKVLVIHFCRLVVGLVLFPLVVNRFTAPIPETDHAEPPAASDETTAHRNTLHLLLALGLSTLGAWVGNLLHIPTASILCPLLITFALNFCGVTICFPNWMRQLAQILSGAYVGCLLDPSLFGNVFLVLAAILITVAVLLSNATVFGKLLEKWFHIPMREGMLMLTPAGASDMALISADIGVNSPRLVLVQIYRLLIATAIFPQICLGISRLF